MKRLLPVLIIFILFADAHSGPVKPAMNDGSITGKVLDAVSRQPLAGASVVVTGTGYGAVSDLDGYFMIKLPDAGRYNLKVSMVGYETVVKPEVVVSHTRPADVVFELSPVPIKLREVTVRSEYFQRDANSVNSITNFSYEEIRRAPGGFEDVIRALSVLPGIAQANPGRNDLVVRGGASSENLYLIDGVIVPNINHFGTQGANGGSLSFIDLNFVRDVSFSSGGFPALYGDKISSVMKINLNDGRSDRIGGKATVSASQFGVNAEGPLSKDLNFLFSARRSYLDFIFKAAGFGFVPEYYDVLGKVTYGSARKHSLSFLFIGAFDNVRFFNNTSDQRYDNSRTLGTDQLQYVSALSYRYLFNDGFLTVNLGRNFVDYDFSQKDTLGIPLFLNDSREQENNLKADLLIKLSPSSELNAGADMKLIDFDTQVKLPFFVTTFGDTLTITSLNKNTGFKKAGIYLQFSDRFSEYFAATAGIRADYFDAIDRSVDISPRASVSYFPDEVSTVSLSAGLYHQNPSYIWLAGDRRNSRLKSIRALHTILGFERRISQDMQFKIEGFIKQYTNYPASLLRPYLILSNTGSGYGGSDDNFSTFALEQLVSSGKGNVKGIELQLQKKASDIPYYGIMSFTYSRSVFTAADGVARAGSYDQQYIFNLSGGYLFNDNWEAALKFRYASGRPVTPFNPDGSQSVSRYNSERLDAIHSLDLRVDRRWFFDDWTLVAYVDIQNVYGRNNVTSLKWDYRNNKVEKSSSIGVLPSIGISAEF